MTSANTSVWLHRSAESTDDIAGLATSHGGTIGLTPVLQSLNRQASKAKVRGRAVDWGFAWNDADQRSERWWPQGITSSADAGSDADRVEGRRLLVTSWYSRQVRGEDHGSRVTFIDLDTLTYRHVLLVVAETSFGQAVMKPLNIHAGGLAWAGPYLHVAATRRGLLVCRLDDIIEVTPGPESFGHRFVLPVRFGYDAGTAPGVERFRYSFVGLEHGSRSALVVGEYGIDEQTTRLLRYPIDPTTHRLVADSEGDSIPLAPPVDGPEHLQGAVVVHDTWYLSTSHGQRKPGNLHTGEPGHLRTHARALPPGPEDLTHWPSTDRLWSQSEYPGKRFVFCMDRATLGG